MPAATLHRPGLRAARAVLAAFGAVVGLAAWNPPALAREPATPRHPAAPPHSQPASSPHAPHGPLRFDPPAAGPGASSTAYEACIDHPSPDGLTSECQALLPPAKAQVRRKR